MVDNSIFKGKHVTLCQKAVGIPAEDSIDEALWQACLVISTNEYKDQMLRLTRLKTLPSHIPGKAK